jgi:hypothetical protein
MHHVFVHAEDARQLGDAARLGRIGERQQNRQNTLRGLIAIRDAFAGGALIRDFGSIDHAAAGGLRSECKIHFTYYNGMEPDTMDQGR